MGSLLSGSALETRAGAASFGGRRLASLPSLPPHSVTVTLAFGSSGLVRTASEKRNGYCVCRWRR